MQTLNLSSHINAFDFNISSTSGSSYKLVKSINITCDLYNADSNVLPQIKEDAPVTPVLRKLLKANVQDSCQWMGEVVRTINSNAVFNCSSPFYLEDTCKKWSSIGLFTTATRTIVSFDSTINHTTNDTTEWIEARGFTDNVYDHIFTIFPGME